MAQSLREFSVMLIPLLLSLSCTEGGQLITPGVDDSAALTETDAAMDALLDATIDSTLEIDDESTPDFEPLDQNLDVPVILDANIELKDIAELETDAVQLDAQLDTQQIVDSTPVVINSCGGQSILDGVLGEDCGTCGELVCDGQENLRCHDLGRNLCMGCAVIENPLGPACGTCGRFECIGPDQIECVEQPQNACGGCEILEHSPGDPCGECGQWACQDNGLVCDDASPCLPCLAERFDFSQVRDPWQNAAGRPYPATDWPVVSDLAVEMRGPLFTFIFDRPDTWIGDGLSCSDLVIMLHQPDGTWIAKTAEHLRCQDNPSIGPSFYGDWPSAIWPINHGDPVGFLVTSQAAPSTDHRIPLYERTEVATTCWP